MVSSRPEDSTTSMKHGTKCLHGGETSVVAAHGHTGHTILLLLVDERPEKKEGKNNYQVNSGENTTKGRGNTTVCRLSMKSS